MAATLSVSSASAALKTYYTNQRMVDLTYKDAPLFAMLPKYKNFEGSSYPLPVRVNNPQGRSATFSDAQGNKQASTYLTFSLTRVKDYSLASIDTESILASRSNPGAFVRLATAEINGAMESLKRSICWALYGDGSGSLGTITEPADTATTVAFQNAEDIVKVEVGQTLQVRSGATPRIWDTGVTEAIVTGVNRDTGVITVDQAYSAANGTMVTGDTINVVGDYNIKLSGLAAWIPSSAPSATAFFGVDRTTDATRLAGIRVTSTGKPLDEALIDAARRANREGGRPDYAFMSYDKYAQLEKTLQGRVRYEEVMSPVGIAFPAIVISGPSGKIKCLPDRDCPVNRIYLLTMDTWGLYSLDEPVQLLDLDGNRMLREASADAYEVRCAFYGQLGCKHPGANAVLTF